ncbi:MAG: AAA family ATPase, partial [Acidimicrobiales bacterium]
MFGPTGLQHLAALHRKAPSAGVVLVADRPPETNLRQIVQVGADDVLPLDVGRDELCLALERVLMLVQHRSGSQPEDSAVVPLGQVITVASPTEGCGKTFLAANTALFLARDAGAKVVLVDLDLQFGEVRMALRARADFSILDALQSESEGHDLEVVLPDLMYRHPGGFSILAAPRNPEDADSISPGDIARVIAALRARADYVVVDAPSGLAEHMLPVLDVTQRLLAVATPDRPSIHNLALFLTTLERLGVGEEIVVMLNKAEDDSDLGEAASRLPQSLTAVLPYDREVARSINLGVPLLEGAPSSPVARELRAVLGRLFPTATGAEPDAAPARPRNRPRVFGGRRQRHLDSTTVLPAGPVTGVETDEEPVAELHVEELPPFLTESEPFLYAGTAPRSADRLRR